MWSDVKAINGIIQSVIGQGPVKPRRDFFWLHGTDIGLLLDLL